MTSSLPLERRASGGSSIMRSMGSERAITSSLASFKTASWTRQVTAATSASSSISSRTRCQCKRSSRSLPIAAMYSHASPTVRSVPPSFVGRGEVSFLERYAGRNMARKTQSGGRRLFSNAHLDAEYRIGADQSGYRGTILQRPRSTGGAIAPMTLNLEWAAWATLLVGDSSGH